MRAGVSSVPCSQMTRRPSRSRVMPFAMFDVGRNVDTVPAATSRRPMKTLRSPNAGTFVVCGTLVKYSAFSPRT